ncbi:unnamed protein product [Vitrella brassicaformis CCMP3155]|uniref:PX domain-containing protein n=4 Tax=Vitrella brassicaformis TaxID=1169539 RepID=A0A0G4GTE0_VITBC|nr:unnamed protein product [Vitrella brassicaformis CCMP3155]|eukprot:CEM33755.1 unnamed protein product [Vitrella brassicaformis CCMP3155]
MSEYDQQTPVAGHEAGGASSVVRRSADDQPISTRIPRTSCVSNTFGAKHTDYIIELEDCGKVTTATRRFKNFADLHARLRRLGIEGLPELPAKKLFGNLDLTFVERRRQALEQYLQSLLKIDAVINDGNIWTFLDAEEATVVVARFLCCREPDGTVTLVSHLQRLAANEVNLFRICHPSVLSALLDLGDTNNSDLHTRLCTILKQLLSKEGSRQLLIEFSALSVVISILEKNIGDGEPPAALVSSAHFFCLSLVEHSPTSLLVFFRNDGGMVQFRRLLRDPKYTTLHDFLALLLWLAMALPEIQSALSEADGIGMEVLAAFYQSPNPLARLLSGLMIATLLKHHRFTHPETAQRAAMSLELLPKDLQSGPNSPPGLEYRQLRLVCKGNNMARIAQLVTSSGDKPEGEDAIPAVTFFVCWFVSVLVTKAAAATTDKPSSAAAAAAASGAASSSHEAGSAAAGGGPSTPSPREDVAELVVKHGLLPAIEHQLSWGATDMVRTLAAVALLHVPWGEEDSPASPSVPPTHQQQSAQPTSRAQMGTRANSMASSSSTGGGASAAAASMRVVSRGGVDKKAASSIACPSFPLSLDLLQQRLTITKVLLEHAERQFDVHKELLKGENERLKAKEELVVDRTRGLALSLDRIDEFLKEFERFEGKREALSQAAQASRAFVGQMRTLLEAQGLTRGGLNVNAEDFASEIRKIQEDAKEIETQYEGAVRKEQELNERKREADALLRSLLEASGILKQSQENLRIVKNQASNHREKWMEVERLIENAPQRKQQLAEQVKYRQEQLETLRHKRDAHERQLAALRQQSSHNDAERAEYDAALTKLKEIEAEYDEWVRHRQRDQALEEHEQFFFGSQDEGPHSHAPASSSRIAGGGTGDGTGDGSPSNTAHHLTHVSAAAAAAAASTADTAHGHPSSSSQEEPAEELGNAAKIASLAAKIPSLVMDESVQALMTASGDASETSREFRRLIKAKMDWVRQRMQPLRTDDTLRSIRQLQDKHKQIEQEVKRLEADLQNLQQQLALQSDPEAMVRKAAELQALCRQADGEVDKKTEEVSSVQAKVTDIEAQLEKKKAEVRLLEASFTAAKEALHYLVDKSNTLRAQLCRRLNAQESELRQLLNETESLRDDSHKLAHHMTTIDQNLLREKKGREEFRQQIAAIMGALQATDRAMGEIDDAPIEQLSPDILEEADQLGGPSTRTSKEGKELMMQLTSASQWG